MMRNQSLDQTILASQVMNYQCTPEHLGTSLLLQLISAPAGQLLIDLFLSSPDIFGSIRISVSPNPFDSDHFPVSLFLSSDGDRRVSRTKYSNRG